MIGSAVSSVRFDGTGAEKTSRSGWQTDAHVARLDRRRRTFLLDLYHRRNSAETKMPPAERWEADGFLPRTPNSLEKLDLLLIQTRDPSTASATRGAGGAEAPADDDGPENSCGHHPRHRGNFRLLNRLLTQIQRLLEINALEEVTKAVVEAAHRRAS
jgi:hypothetical protein